MNWKIILFGTFIVGLILSFIPAFTVIELFLLLIPFSIIFIVTVIYLIVSLFYNKQNGRKALFIFSIIPIFILSQLVSEFTVDKIQRVRSEIIIKEIQKIKTETGNYPEQYDILLGIEYRKLDNKNTFEISYSRGFMVTEKFDSEKNNWNSYGWND